MCNSPGPHPTVHAPGLPCPLGNHEQCSASHLHVNPHTEDKCTAWAPLLGGCCLPVFTYQGWEHSVTPVPGIETPVISLQEDSSQWNGDWDLGLSPCLSINTREARGCRSWHGLKVHQVPILPGSTCGTNSCLGTEGLLGAYVLI